MAKAPALLQARHRGDGTTYQRDLNDYVAGKTIAEAQTGALTDDGCACTLIRFTDGDALLITPQATDPQIAAQTGCRLADRITFLPSRQPRIWTPGQREF